MNFLKIGYSETDIRSIFAQLETAWNSNDAQLLSSLFWPDGEATTTCGAMARGASAIIAVHESPEHSNFTTTALRLLHLRIKVVTPDVVMVDADWEKKYIQTLSGVFAPKKGAVHAVLIQREGVWKILSLHNRTFEKPPVPELARVS